MTFFADSDAEYVVLTNIFSRRSKLKKRSYQHFKFLPDLILAGQDLAIAVLEPTFAVQDLAIAGQGLAITGN